MSAYDEPLRWGITVPDKVGRPILYRYLSPQTKWTRSRPCLHEASCPLAEAGMRFAASHQDSATTRSRMARGETIVAIEGTTLVATVTLASAAATDGSPLYDRPDVASLGQFAVRPSYQRQGVGSALMNRAEQRAAEQGAAELALDTSEQAHGLIALYQTRGYRFIEHSQWPDTNYRSMVFAKRLTPAGKADILPPPRRPTSRDGRLTIHRPQCGTAVREDIMPRRILLWLAGLAAAALTSAALIAQTRLQPSDYRILSGSDIASRVEGTDRSGRPVGTWMVRMNGEWVEPSPDAVLRRLSQ
jgi:GNAT superfamily N-acetyltransferase